jgi:hypothetical protein
MSGKQSFLLFLNVLILTALIIMNRNLKANALGLDSKMPQHGILGLSDLNDEKGDDNVQIPSSSNLYKVLVLLIDLSKLYVSAIQVQKIEYLSTINTADIKIKSYELDDLDSYLKKLDSMLKKEKFSVIQISLVDKDNNKQIVSQQNLDEEKPKAIPFVLAYLQAKKIGNDSDDSSKKAAAAKTQKDGYEINLKIAL